MAFPAVRVIITAVMMTLTAVVLTAKAWFYGFYDEIMSLEVNIRLLKRIYFARITD
jgi:hypothetical protein